MASTATTQESMPRQTGAGPAAAKRSSTAPSFNPLRRAISLGKMPVILELHLTENDRLGYLALRQRYLSDAMALPKIMLLGQYMRQLDLTAADLSPNERQITGKLQVYADLVNGGKIDLVALDDGARGRAALDNAIAAELLAGLGVDPGRLLANVVARNRFPDQIRRRIKHFAELGLRNALLLTGDLPEDRSRPARFPIDSIGMCELARDMLIEGELPEDFLIAAAGHPNPDADPDGLRTLHKALAGAKVIITQAIFNFEPFAAWMDALRRLGVLDMVHVLGEIIPIASSQQLGVLSDIPGMRVPTELVEEFIAIEQRIASAAKAAGHSDDWARKQQRREGVRITRTLIHRLRRAPGVSGFYLGCVKSFDAHVELLRETPLLPEDARGLHKVAKLSGLERQRALAQLPAVETYIDRQCKQSRGDRIRVVRRMMRRVARWPWVERSLRVLEWPKVLAFGCHKCDQCDLSVDALVCPRGCAKQMSHGPCGGPRWVDGRMLCEDTTRECTWAEIRQRREQYGVPMAVRLETQAPPSPGFFEGRSYSAVVPVLAGTKSPPHWGLAVRAPWSGFVRLFRQDYRLGARGSPLDLETLVQSKAGRIRAMLAERPGMDAEELLIKALALVGTPAAHHLIETRLVGLGLPAEGCLADLSIRETFQLAEALPVARRRHGSTFFGTGHPGAGSEELLSVVREDRALRRALRRDLAGRLIQHAASLGVGVTYADVLLDARNVEPFLSALTILKDELQLVRGRLDPACGRLSVQFDHVPYRHHYRAAVSIRRFQNAQGGSVARTQLVIDIRQFQSEGCFRTNVRAALEQLARPDEPDPNQVFLEDFAGESRSVCWAFNGAFWKRLRDFEQARGVNYDDSIGGSTDHNLAYVRSTARAHFDRLHDHPISDGRLYVVEIGVAATHRARAFLDELKRISELTRTHHYEQTTYVLADRSVEILERSAAELAREHPNVEAVRIDAADPLGALAPYRGRVMHVHLCNVYDNLPTDKVARIDGELYHIEGRVCVSRSMLRAASRRHGLPPECDAELEARLMSLRKTGEDGVMDLLNWVSARLSEQGKPALAYVNWWMDVFAALQTEQRYVQVDEPQALPLDGIPGVDITLERLRRHLRGDRDVQVHLSQRALAGFAQLLKVLHPRGVLEVVDLFIQRIEEYEQRFKGPAKYDGSTVNWLNGPLFREVADQLGFTVRFHSFKPFDPKSASIIMVASPATQEASAPTVNDVAGTTLS